MREKIFMSPVCLLPARSPVYETESWGHFTGERKLTLDFLYMDSVPEMCA